MTKTDRAAGKRREFSVEEALIEMYLTGVSMRRVKDMTEQWL